MDFQALMRAAASNHDDNKKQSSSAFVLQTKLATPKVEKKKVDVVAIKRRLEQQRQKDEPPKKKISSEKSTTKKPESKPKKLANGQHSQGQTKPVVMKQIYESKDHGAKHKHFMDKVHKSVSSKKIQPASIPSSSKHLVKSKAATTKPKPQTAPPNFQQIMALAAKVAKDPKSLDVKPASPKPVVNTGSTSKPRKSSSESNKAGKPGVSKKSDADKHNRKSPLEQSKSVRMNQHRQDTSSKKPIKGISTLQPKSCPLREKTKSSGSHRNGSLKPSTSNEAHHRTQLKSAGKLKRPDSAQLKQMKQPKPQPSASKSAPNGIINPNKTAKSKQSIKNNSEAHGKESVKKKWNADDGVSAWDRLMGSSNKGKAKKKRPAYIDSDDSDYDDEDADFIDDDEEGFDYSSEIRNMFGYDKSKYRDEEFDDREMVAGFADVMKEEARSARLGLQEDLSDIKLEEETKKQKMLKKTKKGR